MKTMEELIRLVQAARNGDLAAYGEIVRRFQDMAYGCAYSVLGDFHLAEDAVQEAFIEAYRKLPDLRELKAFPSWFRKVVLKHCDRLTRGKRLATVPLDEATGAESRQYLPDQRIEEMEMREKVLEAVRSLPDGQRMTTTLFYINGYSHKEVAEFLSVPVSTVKKRLYDSRCKLKERMVDMVADKLKSHTLSDEFPMRIRTLLAFPKPLQIGEHPVRKMWDRFRKQLPGFEVIELDEILNRDVLLLNEDYQKFVYRIDETRVLRPELTSQLYDRWIRTGGGKRKWIVAGRLFRANHVETPTVLEVHHQAEVLWGRHRQTNVSCSETILRTARGLLPDTEVREGEELRGFEFFLKECHWYEARWHDSWLPFGAGGSVADEWLAKAGLQPGRHSVLSFAFGLERCAQVAFDLDDARKLWQPPYVPKRQ